MGGNLTKKKDFEMKLENYEKKRQQVFDKYTSDSHKLDQENRKAAKEFQKESMRILNDNFKRRQNSVEQMSNLREK